MAWRKWFVRGVVFTIVGLCAAAAVIYERFTNPTAVREQVLAKLQKLLPGGTATMDSARLRILGGISVSELRLVRTDDPDKTEILHVPSAVIYHDKQKMNTGELVISKVKLERPQLRAQKRLDGSWNLEGISGVLQPHLPLPTITISEGTIVLEDRSTPGDSRSLELTNVQLTLVNDPIATVIIEGSAHSDVAGAVHLHGKWERQTREIKLNITAQQISLTRLVAERLEKLCPSLEGLHIEGTADLQADLFYRPGTSEPLVYEASLAVTGAKLRHPKLPLPLADLHAVVQCSDGVARLVKMQAKSGPAEIAAHGWVQLGSLDNFECHLEAKHLEMHEELFANLPDKMPGLYKLFKPTGLATFRADVAHADGKWTTLKNSGEPATLRLLPESMGVTFERFRYPLTRMTGTVDMNLLTKRVVVDVTGYTPHGDLPGSLPKLGHGVARPVFIAGTWQGERENPDCQFDIVATDMPLDDVLVDALPGEPHEGQHQSADAKSAAKPAPHFQKLARSFAATGKGDIKAFIRHEPGAAEYHNEYHVFFHDAAIRWEQFPYPLENVSGYLDIFPKHWEFRGGKGTHGSAEVLVDAASTNRDTQDGGSDPGLFVDITGVRVPVDEELHRALGPMKHLATSWETFRPRGVLNFRAKIDHHTLDPEDADVQVAIQGGTIVPQFFKLAMDDVAGSFRYYKQRLDIQSASARHNGTRIALDRGTVLFDGKGSHYTDLHELSIDNLVMNDDLLRALEGSLRSAATCFQLRGPVSLKTRLVVRGEPSNVSDIYWDGQAILRNAVFHTGIEWKDATGTLACRGHYNGKHLAGLYGNVLLDQALLLGQPFQNLHASLYVKEDNPAVVHVNVKAPVFGGDIAGEARVDFGPAMRYEINLTGSQIDLGRFGKHNLGPKSELQGAAMARLHLTGHGNRAEALEGHGSIDVPHGRIYNLPLLLDILKFLRLRGPDQTTFEELHAQFSIHGQRVNMRKLEILGTAISLTGQGEFNLDGTDVALDFYPGWARLDQLLPPGVRPLPEVSKNLLTIEMRGKVTANEKDRKFTMKPVPVITNPLLNARDRLIGVSSADKANADRMYEPRAPAVLGGGK